MDFNVKEYLEWLCEFTNRYDNFSDESFSYETLDEEDKQNTQIISRLHNFIEEEKQKQLIIYEDEDDYCISAYFKYKEFYFYIETMFGQGALTYIKRLNSKPEEDFVYLFEEVPEELLKERELIQYIVVNKDLKISPAKMGVHIGHACTIVAVEKNGTEKFDKWYDNGKNQKKIILSGHLKDLEKIENDFYSVRDLGLSEVEKDTLIAVSLGILQKKEAKNIIKKYHFQLLKEI